MVSTQNRNRPSSYNDDGSNMTERVVYTRRIAKVVKGGRRLRFTALVVLGDGNQNKPYMYVHELIDCMFYVIDNSKDKLNEFNVGPKDSVKVSVIATIFIKHFGEGQVIKYTGGKTGWKGDVPFYSHNSKKLNKLGWQPTLNSSEAVEKAIIEMKNEL